MKNNLGHMALQVCVVFAFIIFFAYPVVPLHPEDKSPAGPEPATVINGDSWVGDKGRADPNELVTDFCEMQFTGVGSYRINIVKYTPKAAKREIANDPYDIGFNYSWESDPVTIVESYRIADISISGSKGTATVVYKRLARLGPSVTDESRCRTLEKDFLERDIVTLTLRRVKGMWWIMDPPPPRVSKEGVMARLGELEGILKGQAHDDWPARQWRYYGCIVKTLNFLKGLGGKGEGAQAP